MLFQKTCQALHSSRVQFRSMESVSNISVNVTEIHFNSSAWSAIDVNLNFVNCGLQHMHIVLLRDTSPIFVQLHIVRGQIASNIKVNNAMAILEGSTLFATKVSGEKGIINAGNSSVILKSLHVEMFQGGGFLNVKTGIAHIYDSEFSKCAATQALICASNDSVLAVDNCTFTSNDGQLVIFENNSIGVLNNSVFHGNKALHNSTKFIFHLVGGSSGSLVIVENTNITRNELIEGTPIAIVNSFGIIELSHFSRNTINSQYIYGSVHAEDSKVMINRSMFTNNECRGVSFVNSSNIIVSSSLFHNNSAKYLYGGGLFFYSEAVSVDSIDLDLDIIRNVLAKLHGKHLSVALILSNTLVQIFKQQNITIHNCTFIENSAESGGAIGARNVSLTLVQNVFTNNSAVGLPSEQEGNGGAVVLGNIFTNISDCLFVANKASWGGGIYTNSESLNIESSVFIKNEAVGEGSGAGGAIATTTTNGSLCVKNSTFQKNKASLSGGAIHSEGVRTKIQTSLFSENSATQGGATAINAAPATITGCHFKSNMADIRAGALLVPTGQLTTIGHTSFTRNEASKGGAIYGTRNAILLCKNCSFDNNKAGFR